MEEQAHHSIDGGLEGAAPSYTTPGAALRAAREARGLSREQLCEAIQLERRLLDALESDRFEAFDAPVFARGFLRKSASFLGLDPVEMLAGYDRLQRGPEAPTHIPPTTRITPKRVSPWRLPLLGFAGLLAVGGLLWWLVAGLGGLGSNDASAPVAESLPVVAEPAPSPVALPETAPGDGGVAPAGAALPADPGVNAVPVAGDAPAPADAGADLAAPAPAPVAAASAPGSAKPLSPATASRAVLQFQFAGVSWLNVVGPDGRRLYVGMANPGVLPFAGTGPWQVLIGDVRQVRVSVGGRELVLPKPAPGENVVRFTVTADGQVR